MMNSEKVKNASAGEDKDCLSCKMIGTAAFSSLSAYTWYLRYTTPKADKSHRLFLVVMTLTFGGVAVARALS